MLDIGKGERGKMKNEKISKIIVRMCETAGNFGVPAGVLYAALSYDASAEEFLSRTNALIMDGIIRKEGEKYYRSL